MKETKIYTAIFGIGLVLVTVGLAMGIYTAIQEDKIEEEIRSQPLSIPTPALAP